jgi:hypothetical protein
VTESLCNKAIHEAILAFDRNAPGSWCSPLVEAIELLRAGSCVGWCVDVLAKTLGSDERTEDARTLLELRRLAEQKSSATGLQQKSRDIWYSGELRRPFQTATSKVYEAVAAYLAGDIQHYKRGIAFTISDIALAGMTSSSDHRMQQLLELFKSRCEQLESSSREEH